MQKHMRALLALVTAAGFLTSTPASAVVKSLALDRLADLDRLIGLDNQVLQKMRQSNEIDWVFLTRDHNVLYIDLQNRIGSTFGENPQIGSGLYRCKSAFSFAHLAWGEKANLVRQPSRFGQETLATYQNQYKMERAACNQYLRTLKK